MSSKLPTLLRILGAGALVIAMYSFLATGWQSSNDAIRYLLMLGHTGVLAAAGLASGHWLKESKGARLLLTLALVSVPANFAILGAFVYSQTSLVNLDQYPHFVAWTVESLSAAMLTTGGALLLLAPITLLGFTVLARSMSKRLSLLFLFSNAALLIPLRDPHLVGLLLLALTALTVYFSRRAADNNSAAKTLEGVTALGLQMLPLAVLAGRSLWLYSADLFLMAVLSTTVFFILRQISLYISSGTRVSAALNGLSLIPALSTTMWLTVALDDMQIVPDAWILPIAALGSAAMVYDISRRSANNAGFYLRVASGGLILCLMFNLLISDSLLAAIASAAIGMMTLVLGYKTQQRLVFGTGLILLAAAIVHQFFAQLQHFDLGGWASLATLGVVAIILASLMESQAGKLKPQLQRFKARFQNWDH